MVKTDANLTNFKHYFSFKVSCFAKNTQTIIQQYKGLVLLDNCLCVFFNSFEAGIANASFK